MNRRLWTEQEDAVIRALYPREDIFADDIAARLGRSRGQVHQRAAKLGVRKSPGFRSIAGKIGSGSPEAVAHQFRKGHIPDNKGKKLPPEVYAKVAPTMFKKGNRPVNHREVGSERVNVDGYVEIKVAEPNRWALKQRIVWEQANGPIPKGYNVQFRDGNRLNVSIGNLYLISRREQLLTKNSLIAKYPKELADVIRLRGALKRKIKSTLNRQDNE